MPDEAFERALEALGHKERTAPELAAWLAERGFAPPQVDDALGRLIESGAIDDERFARRFAEDKRELRGWGPRRIREGLAARGLAPEAIAVAIAGDGHSEQLERAIELLADRGQDAVDEPSRARALGYLARRGYDPDLAHEAVRAFERRARV